MELSWDAHGSSPNTAWRGMLSSQHSGSRSRRTRILRPPSSVFHSGQPAITLRPCLKTGVSGHNGIKSDKAKWNKSHMGRKRFLFPTLYLTACSLYSLTFIANSLITPADAATNPCRAVTMVPKSQVRPNRVTLCPLHSRTPSASLKLQTVTKPTYTMLFLYIRS